MHKLLQIWSNETENPRWSILLYILRSVLEVFFDYKEAFLDVSFSGFLSETSGLSFSLMISWSWQSPFTCLPSNLHSFQEGPRLELPHTLLQIFTLERALEISYYGLPLPFGKISMMFLLRWGHDLLLLKYTHSSVKARCWESRGRLCLLGRPLWLETSIHMSGLRCELLGPCIPGLQVGTWKRNRTSISQPHSLQCSLCNQMQKWRE